jgi:hypothetical protein
MLAAAQRALMSLVPSRVRWRLQIGDIQKHSGAAESLTRPSMRMRFQIFRNGTQSIRFFISQTGFFNFQTEEITVRIKSAMIAVAAIMAAAASTAASAQEVIYNPGYCAQFYPNANCQNKGPGNPYTDGSRYRNSQNSWGGYRNDPGVFWPAAAAAGIVGGAVGTAGAIATAPFRGDRYAYNNGYRNEYVANNGFVCQPGTWFKGGDGRRHPCQ